MHLDAVAQHIISNTPGNVPATQSGNADPFTSGGAYRPGASSTGAIGGGGNVDPFTSGGAYRPGPPSGVPTLGGGAREDPLSAKRYRPGNAPPPAPAAPSAAFATFDACKHDAVLAKLMQFNAQLAGEIAAGTAASGAAALDDASAARLVGVVEALKAGPGSAASNGLTTADLALFIGDGGASGGMLSWPLPLLFPVLDLLRLIALHPSAGPFLAAAQPPLLPRLLQLLASAQALGAADKPAAASALMLLRTFANCASRKELRATVASAASELLDVLHTPLESGPTGARLAALTVMMNLCSLLSHGGELPASAALKSDAWTLQALSLIAFALSSVPALTTPPEEEALHRLLHALAALVSGHAGAASAAETARELELPAALAALALPPTASPAVVAAKERCVSALKK